VLGNVVLDIALKEIPWTCNCKDATSSSPAAAAASA
jgi:hypothetical protein